ncbi:hypothetical protein [Paraglaciecola sp.]|uniref:hypothetical protein n=1 Tax=Paraglaciecola sp. TaxID=1920173 RepID=UPI0032636D1C
MYFLDMALATYLEIISNSLQDSMSQLQGTQVEARRVQHKGHQISYSYQLWKVQNKSVCSNHFNDLNEKSLCSQAAKEMFRDMCFHLQNNKKSGWRYTKTKNMYCNAASNYKPVIATVSFDEKTTEQKNKEKCSIARLRLSQSPTAKNLKLKESACSPSE